MKSLQVREWVKKHPWSTSLVAILAGALAIWVAYAATRPADIMTDGKRYIHAAFRGDAAYAASSIAQDELEFYGMSRAEMTELFQNVLLPNYKGADIEGVYRKYTYPGEASGLYIYWLAVPPDFKTQGVVPVQATDFGTVVSLRDWFKSAWAVQYYVNNKEIPESSAIRSAAGLAADIDQLKLRGIDGFAPSLQVDFEISLDEELAGYRQRAAEIAQQPTHNHERAILLPQ